MDKYIMARGFRQENMLLTREIAERIFQIDPAPPKMENLNDYILAALEKKDLQYFSFFLHQYEPRLNRVIRGALAQDADIRYDPELLMDMKMNCVHMMLKKLETYDPSEGAAFTTYIYHDIFAGLLKKIFCQDSHWTNFRCHIEGFIIAISVVFAFFEFWDASIILWVYVIAFYFNFDFEDFKGQFSIFLRSLPRIILSCFVWLSVLGLSYLLDGIIQEHSVAVKVPWFLTIGVGIVWLTVMKVRKKRTR